MERVIIYIYTYTQFYHIKQATTNDGPTNSRGRSRRVFGLGRELRGVCWVPGCLQMVVDRGRIGVRASWFGLGPFMALRWPNFPSLAHRHRPFPLVASQKHRNRKWRSSCPALGFGGVRWYAVLFVLVSGLEKPSQAKPRSKPVEGRDVSQLGPTTGLK